MMIEQCIDCKTGILISVFLDVYWQRGNPKKAENQMNINAFEILYLLSLKYLFADFGFEFYLFESDN